MRSVTYNDYLVVSVTSINKVDPSADLLPSVDMSSHIGLVFKDHEQDLQRSFKQCHISYNTTYNLL